MLDDETKSFMGHRLNAPEGCVPFYRSRKKSKRIQLFGENARESSRFAVCAPLRSHTTRPPAACIPPSPAGIQPAFLTMAAHPAHVRAGVSYSKGPWCRKSEARDVGATGFQPATP